MSLVKRTEIFQLRRFVNQIFFICDVISWWNRFRGDKTHFAIKENEI